MRRRTRWRGSPKGSISCSARPCLPDRRSPTRRRCDAAEALWRDWAPWTFAFNLTRQPAITVPMPAGEDGLPRSVQVAAALYRDDLVLRAARVIEQGAPVGVAPV